VRIPGLLYHTLESEKKSREKYTLSRGQFEQQMRFLFESGFASVLLDDVCDPYSLLATKAVAITFDDGNLSDYSVAHPILRKYGFVATFFIPTAWIGRKNYVDWTHLRHMALEGMSIQSHGLTHAFLSDLSEDALSEELHDSKRVIEENLGTSVKYISMPGGYYSNAVLRLARQAGYRGVMTSTPGLNCSKTNQMEFFLLKRFNITQKTSFDKFVALANGDLFRTSLERSEYLIKSSIRRVLGNRAYYTIWSKFSKYVNG
jgi:peptidoglycan/xylan/chitin deacetylase (PgdA/CDA1 family)